MPTITQSVRVVPNGGTLIIQITELSVDSTANTSRVQVTGTIRNDSSNVESIHLNQNIPCSIGGDQGFTGTPFGFDLLPGKSRQFIQHSFTVDHDSDDGTGSAHFVVGYGVTNTEVFGDNKSLGATLTLTKIPQQSNAPSNIVFSNILPTSLTVAWTPPSDNGGTAIDFYLLRGFLGDNPSGSVAVNTTVTGTSRNLTGLKPGQDYTFIVEAHNGGGDTGYSDFSDPETVQTLAGSWMRVDGVWKVAIPYVRKAGVWKMAVPWIRVAGVWQQTH